MDRLSRHAEHVGDVLPRPAEQAGTFDVQRLQPVGQDAQRADGAEPLGGVVARGGRVAATAGIRETV